MANAFDEFDTPAVAAPGGNAFDEFDGVHEPQISVALARDVALKRQSSQVAGQGGWQEPTTEFVTDVGQNPLGFIKSIPDSALNVAGQGIAGALNLGPRAYRAITGTPQVGVIQKDAQGRDILTSVDKPLPFSAGQPIYQPQGTVLQPEGNDLQKLAAGFTTPEMLPLTLMPGARMVEGALKEGTLAKALASRVMGSVPVQAMESKPVQGMFLAQTAPAAIEALGKVIDPNTPASERGTAATDALINSAFSAGLVHGLMAGKGGHAATKEPRMEPQQQPALLSPEVKPNAFDEFDTQPPASTPTAPTASDLASLQATMQSNQIKPSETAKADAPSPVAAPETAPPQAPPVDLSRVEVRTPDGKLDHVQTALARIRLEAQQSATSSEPTPAETPTVEPSDTGAGTTVSPALVDSNDVSQLDTSEQSHGDTAEGQNDVAQGQTGIAEKTTQPTFNQGDSVISENYGKGTVVRTLGKRVVVDFGDGNPFGVAASELQHGVQYAAGDFAAANYRKAVSGQGMRPGTPMEEKMRAVGAQFAARGKESVQATQQPSEADEAVQPDANYDQFASGQQTGLHPQAVTDAINEHLGTPALPRGIRVIRDETLPWGAKIEGRNSIVVNAAQVSTPARVRQVILEEGLHGVWSDPAVQRAWQAIRDLVTPAEMRAEYLKRQQQGLPTDPETIREEAAIARLLKADASKGLFARLYDVVRNVIRRTFGIDLPVTARQQLKDAAMEFLRNRNERQGARGEFSTHESEQFHQQESQLMPGQQRLFGAGEQPGFFDQPESVTDQRARMANEKRAADQQKAKQTIQDRAQRRLTGSDIDTTGEMFGGEVKLDKAGQGSLFAVGDNYKDIRDKLAVVKDAPKIEAGNKVPNRDIVQRAVGFIRQTFGRTITAADGSDILFKNPKWGSLEQFTRHLISDNDSTEINRFKAATVPLMEFTLTHAQLRLYDPRYQTRVYVCRVAPDAWHMVFVDSENRVEYQGNWNSTKKYVETQFSPNPIQGTQFKVEWENNNGAPGGSARLRQPQQSSGTSPTARGQGNNLTNPASGQDRHALGEFPVKRSVYQVKSDVADAETALREATKPRDGISQKDYKQQAAQAAARYRTLRDELSTHPDYVAEQILKQHEAIQEANRILKPMGKTVSPDDFPNPAEVAAKLGPEAAQRVNELADHITAASTELTRTDRLAPKMRDRITNEMMNDGRLPKMQELSPNSGRTLQALTEKLNAVDSDSPKLGFAERLAIGKRFADTVTAGKDLFRKAIANSMAASRALKATWDHPPVDDDYRSAKKSWISYDARTAIENSRYAKALVAKVPQKIRRAAISVWLDAGGDTSTLKFQRDSVPEKYRAVWGAALKLTPGERQIALDIKQDFENKLHDALNVGLIQQGREDYGVPQRWKVSPQIDQDATGQEKKQGRAGNPYAKLDSNDPFWAFQRETPSYFDGIIAKGEPEDMDVAHLVTLYDMAFHKALSSRGFIRSLKDATAKDGQPIAKFSGSAILKRGEGGWTTFADSDQVPKDAVTADGRPYVAVDHWALKGWKFGAKDAAGNPVMIRGRMLVHPDYVHDIKNELETPQWTTQGIGKAALKTSAYLKASKFIGPFHVVTEALHASFHGVVPSVHGFDIDLNDPKQALLLRNMTVDMGRAHEMFDDGIRNAHGGIWGHVPGLGEAVVRMNNFTFNEYIPRLKMKVGLAVLERNIARYSDKLSMEQIGEITGRQMDAAFGGQNWRLMGTNKSALAVTRLGLVAPDFLISRAKVVGQAFKPYNKEQRVFLLAQAVGVYAISRVLNSIFSDDHDPHWEMKNWDSVVIGKRAYHARFIVSDAANLARDLLGLRGFSQHGIPFITGRLGVIPKTGIEALTGKDLFTGQNKEGLFDTDNPLLKAFSTVAKDTAEWMTPMMVDGFIGGARKGQSGLGQVAAATFGVSSSKENSAGPLYDLARQFNLSSKDKSVVLQQKQRDAEDHAGSRYGALNNLLDAGDTKAAQKEYDSLKEQGVKPESIQRYYSRFAPFTGNAAQEAKFKASLTPDKQKLYAKALEEHQARVHAFNRLVK